VPDTAAPLVVTADRPRPAVCVVRVSGALDLTTAPPLARSLRELTATRPAELVLDMAGVPFLAAAGVELLVRAQRNEDGIRGRLHVTGVRGNPAVGRVLELTGVRPLLDVHDDLESLLAVLDTG
jgi:anti-anti-sigma factor